MSAGVADRAASLRAAFDRGFASPVRRDAAATQDFLTIRLDGERWAIRLGEIAGLYADRRVTPVPSGSATLLGVAGFRGTIVPVHDLAALLGRAAAAAPRWLVLAAAAPVGFAFAAFDRHVRLAAAAIVARHDAAGLPEPGRECLDLGDRIVPVATLRALLDGIAKSASPPAVQKEP